jgi:hypothetical protein
MRCLVKAIACHGLGLYIYAGEDVPSDDRDPLLVFEEQHLQALRDAAIIGQDALRQAYSKIPKSDVKTAFWNKHGQALLDAANTTQGAEQ